MAKYKQRKKEKDKYLLTGKRASRMIREAAEAMGLDLKKADLEKTRKILSKGTPITKILLEMRGRE